MEQYIFLEEIAEVAEVSDELITETEASIPQRPASTNESLQLIGEGWASIFIVILIIIGVTMLLNRVFSKKK